MSKTTASILSELPGYATIIFAFDSEDGVDEIGFIPPCSEQVIYVDKKLGISANILKPIFKGAISEYNRLRILESSAHNRDLVIATLLILLVRGEIPQVFNTRKRLILHNCITCSKELMFLEALFTQHPKSPAGWEHRRWCLRKRYQTQQQLINDQQNIYQPPHGNPSVIPNFFGSPSIPIILSEHEFEIELNLCTRMSESYPKNYFSWLHRLWVIKHVSIQLLQSLLQRELEFTENWFRRHTSDHCTTNHRQQVIYLLLQRDKSINEKVTHRSTINSASGLGANFDTTYITTPARRLSQLFSTSSKLLQERPGSEALWCSRRALAQSLIQLVQSRTINVTVTSQSFCGCSNENNNIINDSNEYILSLDNAALGSETELLEWLCIWHHSELIECERLSSEETIQWNIPDQRLLRDRYVAFTLFIIIRWKHSKFGSMYSNEDKLGESSKFRSHEQLFTELCQRLQNTDPVHRCWSQLTLHLSMPCL